MTRFVQVLALFVALAFPSAALGQATPGMGRQPCAPMPMGRMAPADAPAVPPVAGYSEGRRILFLHTEASDPKIAQMLTDMMASPVLLVPSLAKAPAEIVARVYVYKNGVKPEGPKGPLGFQPDVFDNPPGTPGYTPLRRVHLVTWKDEKAARLQRSAAEVAASLARGEITVEDSGVVVNMPFLTWPGGKR